MRRRSVLGLFVSGALLLTLVACGGGQRSTLRTLGSPSGQGAIDLSVANQTSTIVNNLYLAESQAVDRAGRAAFEGGSPEQAALWGSDVLPGGLEVGGQVKVTVPGPGRYDVRAVARDGEREQHVANLNLRPGGRYVLELHDGGWRPIR